MRALGNPYSSTKNNSVYLCASSVPLRVTLRVISNQSPTKFVCTKLLLRPFLPLLGRSTQKTVNLSRLHTALRARALMCAMLLLLAFTAKAQLTANFSANNTIGCPGLTVNFSNLSTGNPTSYEWDLGNGNPAYIANPGAVYDDPGLYTITLIVFDANGSDTLVLTDFIEVINPPQPNFAVSDSTGCDPFPVSFTNLTTSDVPVVSYGWDFGDGNGSSATDPQHTWSCQSKKPG